jgi:DNA-binding MarR family transcriptional regulator
VLEPSQSILTRRHRITAIRIGNAVLPLLRLNANMHMIVVKMFLIVAQEDGLTVSELAKRCGVRKNIASRYLSDLGSVDRHGQLGLGLITMVQRVYGDRRQRHVHLTERGLEVTRLIQVALTEDRPRKRF